MAQGMLNFTDDNYVTNYINDIVQLKTTNPNEFDAALNNMADIESWINSHQNMFTPDQFNKIKMNIQKIYRNMTLAR